MFSIAYSQENQGLQELAGSLEYLAESEENFKIPEEILEELTRFRENPLNINEADRQSLESLSLFSEYQISSLLNYIENYGKLLTYQEILSIPGFNKTILDQIKPFIELTTKPRALIQYEKKKSVKGYIFTRYSRKFDQARKYLNQNNKSSSTENFLGSQDRLFLKTTVEMKNKFQLGFRADKDAGEPFLGNSIPDSLKNKIKPGFDFYSGYITAKDIGFLKKIVVGDFHVQTGQGLTI